MEMMSKAEHLILSSMVHGTPLEQHHLVPRMKQRRMGMEWGQSTWAKNPAKKSQKGCTDGTDGWIWLLKFWTERHSKCSTLPGTDISYIFFKKCIIIYIHVVIYFYFNISIYIHLHAHPLTTVQKKTWISLSSFSRKCCSSSVASLLTSPKF